MMRKVNIILFIFLIIVVLSSTIYFSVFYGKDNPDFTLYKKAFTELTSCEKYDELKDINIEAKKTKSEKSEAYLVSIVFNNPRFMMKDIDVLVIEKNPREDVIYPSLGLVHDDKIDLVVSNPSNDNQKSGLALNMSLANDVDKLYIYFSYIINDERVTKFYEVKVDATTR